MTNINPAAAASPASGARVAGTSKLAPGLVSLAGVFTDPQFQLVIRALNQKKGVDLLSAPRVTTKSGQKAIIEVVREFRYPTEFQPPQIPSQVGGGNGGGGGAVGGTTINRAPITPLRPQLSKRAKWASLSRLNPLSAPTDRPSI